MSTALQQPFSPLFGHARPNVRPDEVAEALGCSVRQVFALEEQGSICAVAIGDAQERVRERLRFNRASVEGFYALRMEQRSHSLPFELSPEAARWRDHLKAAARNRPQQQPNQTKTETK